jgi:multidrug efflux system membrane fusion protein
MFQRRAAVCAISLLAVAAAGPGSCEKKPAPQISEPPVVTIAQAIRREVTDYSDYTGRLDSQFAVDIRARVTGYIEQTPFKEGEEVKKGDLLFLIDERPYQAQLAQAQAQVLLNDAAYRLAKANNIRAKSLTKTPGVITQQDLDQYQATEDQARAQVESAKAAVTTYQLNLEFCRVTSPIDGQVSRYYYTVGNLVNQDSTLLTTVVSTDPIYCYFDIDSITVDRVKREINEGRFKPLREVGARPLYIGLSGETGFPHRGNLTFVNNRVDPNTQTLTARGVFDNPRPDHGTRLLTPGIFVRVRLPFGEPHQSVLVAERALGTDQDKKFLYVVNSDNKVEYRGVTTGPLQPDAMRVVETGLKAGEWVIVSGLQQARPNAEVTPERTTMSELLGGGAGAANRAPAAGANETGGAPAPRRATITKEPAGGSAPSERIPEQQPSPGPGSSRDRGSP